MKYKNEMENEAVNENEKEIEEFFEEQDNGATRNNEVLVNPADKAENKKRKRYVSAVAAFVIILGVGVMGNWYYQNSDVSSTIQPLIDSATEKTLGKAELVDATANVEEDTYFTKARMERNTARDTALEKLQSVVDSADEELSLIHI